MRIRLLLTFVSALSKETIPANPNKFPASDVRVLCSPQLIRSQKGYGVDL